MPSFLAGRRRPLSCALALLFALLPINGGEPLPPATAAPPAFDSTPLRRPESLHYSIEWRLFNAGIANLAITPDLSSSTPRWHSTVHLESTGVLATFFKLTDDYEANLEDEFCALNTVFSAHEGKRSRETRVVYDRARLHATYVEKDRVKSAILHAGQVDIPACAADVIGGLYRLRALRLEPGQSARLPMSDGKKSAQVRVEALGREEITTKIGKFKTIRYEASLFNGVIYKRRADVQLWLSDDARRLPVQFQIRLPIVIGTITVQLDKEDPS